MRIVQFKHTDNSTQVGMVEGNKLRLLKEVTNSYELAQKVFETGKFLTTLIEDLLSTKTVAYEPLIASNQILLPLTHPDPYRSWITGTGLTHLGSAASRDKMHQKFENSDPDELTDSMKMFQMGLDGGKMNNNEPGVQPEWFYKGNGLCVVPSGHPLVSPPFALDAGEEPELAGLYVIDPDGDPFRVGFAIGNEFSDHKMEKINYLYLAHSKLRASAYGPELLISELPDHLQGHSSIIRKGKVVWQKDFLTGNANMSHNIANLEYHHFKYELFRQPGDVHVHYFGTAVASFADGIEVQDGDRFEIAIPEFGKPLVNPLKQL
ncbi:AraD1 family protein [Cyclobacterium jeungdonense]|uniref:GguC family protein n=1 Tax=Cyclobacterium jeungdonense TaxID=708087 RepID=A0ABT8CEH1_9BACT|nr:AraD1 family protein [Cyclobacterium jeungdonense]MDN3690462.1 GguC family protein [Cyclobacterium jeungdonense]